MAKIIAVTNQKGGVGKTTSAVNISAGLAIMGRKVLLVDIDPQGNSSSGFGIEAAPNKSVYDVLMGNATVKEARVRTKWCDVLPTDNNLAGAEIELVATEGREYILKNALDKVRDEYDYIFIDCPPSLGLITLNALCAADGVLIPIQCEYYALEGVSALMGTIQKVQKINRKLSIEGRGAHDARREDKPGPAGRAGGAQGIQGQGVQHRRAAQRAPGRGAQPRAADSSV